MIEYQCKFCHSTSILSSVIAKKEYFFCRDCGGVFLSDDFLIDECAQKERYLFHNNSLSDEGYKKYLKEFLDLTLNFYIESEKSFPPDLRLFDFGSGPEPCLVQLIKSYCHCPCHYYIEEKTLPKATVINFYDKFFAAENGFVESDIAFCLEVAEHFENPAADFENLAKCVKIGGYLAVGTNFLPKSVVQAGENGTFVFCEEQFAKWWYKNDVTHVCFYTPKAIYAVAQSCGFEFAKMLSPKCAVFKKVL